MYSNNFLYRATLLIFVSIIAASDNRLYSMEKEKSDEIELSISCGVAESIGGPRARYDHMEDTHIIQMPLSKDEPNTALFGIFDGHGGSAVSEFIRDNIVGAINNVDGDDLQKLCTGLKNVNNKIENEIPQADKMGSCAIMALVRGSNLHVANVGDSRAIISRNKKTEALSIDQNVGRDDEHDRISKLKVGGKPIRMKDERLRGPQNRGIGVSRALGDFIYKPYGIIDDAEVKETTFDENDDFLILASDGIFEREFTNEQAVAVVTKALEANNNNPQLAAQALIEKAKNNGSMDNLTAIVILPKNFNLNEERTDQLVSKLQHDVVNQNFVTIKEINNHTSEVFLLIIRQGDGALDFKWLCRNEKCLLDIKLSNIKGTDESVTLYEAPLFKGKNTQEVVNLLMEANMAKLMTGLKKVFIYRPTGDETEISFAIKSDNKK